MHKELNLYFHAFSEEIMTVANALIFVGQVIIWVEEKINQKLN